MSKMLDIALKQTSMSLEAKLKHALTHSVNSVLARAPDLLNSETNSNLITSGKSITTEQSNISIPVLSVFRRGPAPLPSDFQRLVPDIKISQVIRSRYFPNLKHNGSQYLFFNTLNDCKAYARRILNDSRELDGIIVSVHAVPDFADHLKHLYIAFLPDLKGLEQIFNYAMLSTKNESQVGSSKIIDSLLSSSLSCLKTASAKEDSVLVRMTESLLLEQAQKMTEKQKSRVFGAKIDRSCCVLFRNIPIKIDPLKIKDFLWDLDWYPIDEINLREVFRDERRNRSTYVLIFNNRRSAERCVTMCHGEPLFYEQSLPFVEAELLDHPTI